MIYKLSQKFYFEAAHTLDRQIDAEGSRRIHGHTYDAEITIKGQPDPVTGMVMDIGMVRREITRVRGMLDHRFLDDVEDLGAGTLENLCAFIFRHLEPALPGLCAVSVERHAAGDRCLLERAEAV